MGQRFLRTLHLALDIVGGIFQVGETAFLAAGNLADQNAATTIGFQAVADHVGHDNAVFIHESPELQLFRFVSQLVAEVGMSNRDQTLDAIAD